MKLVRIMAATLLLALLLTACGQAAPAAEESKDPVDLNKLRESVFKSITWHSLCVLSDNKKQLGINSPQRHRDTEFFFCQTKALCLCVSVVR